MNVQAHHGRTFNRKGDGYQSGEKIALCQKPLGDLRACQAHLIALGRVMHIARS